jgi:hypothetical protein
MSHEEKVEAQLTGIEHRLAAIEHRFAAVEGRLIHLQTIGTWLFAGLLASYAAVSRGGSARHTLKKEKTTWSPL